MCGGMRAVQQTRRTELNTEPSESMWGSRGPRASLLSSFDDLSHDTVTLSGLARHEQIVMVASVPLYNHGDGYVEVAWCCDVQCS